MTPSLSEQLHRLPSLGAAFLAALAPSPSESIEVRYAPTGLVLCKPTLAGQEVGWFVFDTGASHHVIDPAVSRALGLEHAGSSTSRTPAGTTEVRRVEAQDVRLGRAHHDRQTFVEIDMGLMQAAMGDDVVGVLGYDAFATSVLEFDYRGGRLVLHDPEGFDGSDLDWLPVRIDARRICVDARLEGHRESFEIDTGSNGRALVFAPTVRRLDLLADREVEETRDLGIDGSVACVAGRLASFELAGRAWRDTRAVFYTTETGTPSQAGQAGLLGCAYLEPFTMFLDCGSERVAFRPHPTVPLGPRALEPHAGLYRRGDVPDLEVAVREGALALRQGVSGWIALQAVGGGVFHVDGDTRYVRFVREDAEIAALEVVQRGQEGVRFERKDG